MFHTLSFRSALKHNPGCLLLSHTHFLFEFYLIIFFPLGEWLPLHDVLCFCGGIKKPSTHWTGPRPAKINICDYSNPQFICCKYQPQCLFVADGCRRGVYCEDVVSALSLCEALLCSPFSDEIKIQEDSQGLCCCPCNPLIGSSADVEFLFMIKACNVWSSIMALVSVLEDHFKC